MVGDAIRTDSSGITSPSASPRSVRSPTPPGREDDEGELNTAMMSDAVEVEDGGDCGFNHDSISD